MSYSTLILNLIKNKTKSSTFLRSDILEIMDLDSFEYTFMPCDDSFHGQLIFTFLLVYGVISQVSELKEMLYVFKIN